MKKVLFALFAVLFASGCGLTDDERNEEDRRVYVSIPDPAFHKFCVDRYDTDSDGRISRYEARSVRQMDCSGLGIRSMAGIDAFTSLRELNCSDNLIENLDLRSLTELQRLDCAHNSIAGLYVSGLLMLVRTDCSHNRIGSLDLTANPSLSELLCGGGNPLVVLDLSGCAVDFGWLDTVGDSELQVIYLSPIQKISTLSKDSWTQIERV